jgi:hypothetical protein
MKRCPECDSEGIGVMTVIQSHPLIDWETTVGCLCQCLECRRVWVE